MIRKIFCIVLVLGFAGILVAKGIIQEKSDLKTSKTGILSHSPSVNSNITRARHIGKSHGADQSEDTLHWDSGLTYTGIGLTQGGTFEGAARFTPEMSCSLKAVVFFHWGYISHSGNIKIYGQGTNVTPGSLITSTPYTVPDSNWLRVDLPSPVFLSGGVDFWASVEITHAANEFPLGADFGPMVQDRGGFVSADGGATWIQLNTVNLDYNLNIWAIVEFVHLDHDVGATSILAPAGAVPQGSIITPKVIVHNFGSNRDTFPVTMEIGTIYSQTITDVGLEPDQTDTIEFPDWTAVPGSFVTKAYTALVGDMNPLNDTIRGSVAVAQYVEDFEANDGAYIPDPLTGGWEWGIPIYGPGSAHSGTKVWATALSSGIYTDSANWKLTSVDFQATSDNPELRFWHWYDMESDYDGGNLKISTDGGNTWTIVTPQSGYPGTAWQYNAGIPNEPCYNGTSAGWEEAVFTLPVITGQIFQLRWHFGTDYSIDYAGWYIDDMSGAGFNIVTIDHDVSATKIVRPEGSVPQGTPITPAVVIRNFGINNETFPMVMQIGNVYCETLPSVSLDAGLTDTVEFPNWDPVPGSYVTTAFTDLIGDMRRANDTIHGSCIVVDFVQNFGATNGGYSPDPSTGAWEWGVPTSGPMGAHSGTNVWGTVLGDTYIDYANWKLTSSGFQATQNNPQLRFWHWYDMENYYDGGNVKISTDGGANWTIVTPEGGYPEDAASPDNIGIPNEPCYSGHPRVWEEAMFTLPVNNGQTFKLRWHFGTDVSVTYDGWYIDDVSGAGFMVGISENVDTETPNQFFLSVLPNPTARHGAKISFGVERTDYISLTVCDAAGRVVRTLADGNFESGKYNFVWNTRDNDGRNATSGVYFIVFRNGENKLTKKLILSE